MLFLSPPLTSQIFLLLSYLVILLDDLLSPRLVKAAGITGGARSRSSRSARLVLRFWFVSTLTIELFLFEPMSCAFEPLRPCLSKEENAEPNNAKFSQHKSRNWTLCFVTLIFFPLNSKSTMHRFHGPCAFFVWSQYGTAEYEMQCMWGCRQHRIFSFATLICLKVLLKFLTCLYILVSFWRPVKHALVLPVHVEWWHPSAAYCAIGLVSEAAKIFIQNLISLIQW